MKNIYGLPIDTDPVDWRKHPNTTEDEEDNPEKGKEARQDVTTALGFDYETYFAEHGDDAVVDEMDEYADAKPVCPEPSKTKATPKATPKEKAVVTKSLVSSVPANYLSANSYLDVLEAEEAIDKIFTKKYAYQIEDMAAQSGGIVLTLQEDGVMRFEWKRPPVGYGKNAGTSIGDCDVGVAEEIAERLRNRYKAVPFTVVEE